MHHYIITFTNESGQSDWKEVNDEYEPSEGETLHVLNMEESIGVIASLSDSFTVVANEDPTQLPYVVITE